MREIADGPASRLKLSAQTLGDSADTGSGGSVLQSFAHHVDGLDGLMFQGLVVEVRE